MPTYLSTDPNAGLDESPKYLSTDPNAGLGDSKYLSTDPQAGLQPSQDAQGSVQTGDAAGDAYMKRVAELNKKPAESLSQEDMARTGQLTSEPGAVTGGTEQDPINQQGIVPASLIQAGYKTSPLYWAGKMIAPQQTEDISKGLSESVAGFTSPNNIGLLATAPLMPEGILGKVAGTALGAYFEAQQIKADPAEVAELRDAYAKGDLKTVTKVVSELGIGHVLPLFAALHADAAKQPEGTSDVNATPNLSGAIEEVATSKPEAPPIQRVSPETGQTFYDYEGRNEPVPKSGQPPPVATDLTQETPQKSTVEPQTSPDVVSGQGETGVAERYAEEDQPGSVIPGEGKTWEEFLDSGRDFINKGGDPRLPIRRAQATGLVGGKEVGIVRAEYERLAGQKRAAAEAVDVQPNDPVLQQRLAQAEESQRAWRKEMQPVLTKASDSLRAVQGKAVSDISTYSGLHDLVVDAFDGDRQLTPQERIQLQKVAKGVREVNGQAQEAASKTADRVIRSQRAKVMSIDELKGDLENTVKGLYSDCFL